jgi:hypothetical protein
VSSNRKPSPVRSVCTSGPSSACPPGGSTRVEPRVTQWLTVLISALAVGCADATYSDDDATLDSGLEPGAGATNPGATVPGASNPGASTSEDGTQGSGAMPTGTAPGSSTAPGGSDGASDDGGVLFGGEVTPPISVGTDPMPDATGTTPDDNDEPPIVACAAAVAQGDTPLIDDFEDGDLQVLEQDGRDANWYGYNSANSDDQLVEVESVRSPAGGELALHTAGSGFQWAGLGLGLRWGGDEGNCVYDASAYEGLTFWGRGSGSTRFTASMPETIPSSDGGTCDELMTSCWNHPGVDVTFQDAWQQYVVPFADMAQGDGELALDPTRIRTIQFETGASATFDFWVDGFAFYSAAHPPPDAIEVEPDPIEPDPIEPEPEPFDAGVEPPAEVDASIDDTEMPPPSELDAAASSLSEGGMQ